MNSPHSGSLLLGTEDDRSHARTNVKGSSQILTGGKRRFCIPEFQAARRCKRFEEAGIVQISPNRSPSCAPSRSLKIVVPKFRQRIRNLSFDQWRHSASISHPIIDARSGWKTAPIPGSIVRARSVQEATLLRRGSASRADHVSDLERARPSFQSM